MYLVERSIFLLVSHSHSYFDLPLIFVFQEILAVCNSYCAIVVTAADNGIRILSLSLSLNHRILIENVYVVFAAESTALV